MFIRWQSRPRESYFSHWAAHNRVDHHSDVHWNATLIKSVRVNGKPRQKHIANLCGFTEQQIKIPFQQIYVWQHAIKTLDRLSNRITPAQRCQFEAALAERLGRPKPTKREIAAAHRRRRHWSRAEKERIVAAAMEPGAVASEVARAAGIHTSQLFRWRQRFVSRQPQAQGKNRPGDQRKR